MRCISYACSSDNDFYTCVRAPNSILVVCVTPALSNNLRNTQTHERNHRIHHASHVVAVDKFDLIVRDRFFSQIPDGFTNTANLTRKFTALSYDSVRTVYCVVAGPLFLLRPNKNTTSGISATVCSRNGLFTRSAHAVAIRQRRFLQFLK